MRAARRTARRFDDALRPLGITSGQFSILVAIAASKGASLGEIADRMGMDRTTLTRNLKPLEAEGVIATEADPDDARRRRLVLTQTGGALLTRATPHWQTAQQATEAQLAGPAAGARAILTEIE